MNLKTRAGGLADIDPREVLRAAGVIYQARRRTRGGPPLRSFACRWCKAEVRGRIALEAHERACQAKPDGYDALTDADLDALRWPG